VPRVAIVGERNSGKTTFLGLLYTAQVKFGSDKADDFRFHAAFESLDEITGVFQRLMSGSFPDSATKEGIREVTFRLGYKRPGRGILSRQRSQSWSSDAFDSFHLIVLRTFEDEVARAHEGSSIGDATLRDAIGSDAVVILVDASKLAAGDEDSHVAHFVRYDGAIEALLTAIQHSRAHGPRTLLHPIFVFSKFDRVDPKALRASNLEDAPPAVRKKGPRAAYAQTLLDRHLPKTMAKIRARERKGLEFATPSYFFTWVRADEAAAERAERVRLRRSGAAGWEPDYSSEEYLAFLECLWNIAAHAKD
jgi:hypothetical protein